MLHLPTVEKMWENSAIIEEKYNLPGFMGGTDGTYLVFDGKPRLDKFCN